MKPGTTYVYCIAEAVYFFDDQITQFLGKIVMMALGLALIDHQNFVFHIWHLNSITDESYSS